CAWVALRPAKVCSSAIFSDWLYTIHAHQPIITSSSDSHTSTMAASQRSRVGVIATGEALRMQGGGEGVQGLFEVGVGVRGGEEADFEAAGGEIDAAAQQGVEQTGEAGRLLRGDVLDGAGDAVGRCDRIEYCPEEGAGGLYGERRACGAGAGFELRLERR